MKPKNFLIFLGVVFSVTGILIWSIISNYYERQEKISRLNTKQVVMYKNPGCECCDRWASYMQKHGFEVTIHKADNMPAIKAQQHVPANMQSCHTALIGRYVVEGHVPVEDINRLLKEQPDIIGLAAPGMPASSPGMNTALNEPFDVFTFSNNNDNRIYARH